MKLQNISGITILFLLISSTALAVPVTPEFSGLKYENVLAEYKAIEAKDQISVDKWIAATKYCKKKGDSKPPFSIPEFGLPVTHLQLSFGHSPFVMILRGNHLKCYILIIVKTLT